MRQLVAFTEAIHVRTTKKEYYRMHFHASLQGAEIAPLEEILGVPLEENASEFDEDTDKKMEAHALKLLEERRAKLNVR